MDIKVPFRTVLTRVAMLIKKKMMIQEVDMIDPGRQLTIKFVKNNICQDLLLKMQELKWHTRERWLSKIETNRSDMMTREPGKE